MKARLTAVGVAIGLAIALTVGFAFGASSSEPRSPSGAVGMTATSDSMHDSPTMETMHARMPAALRGQCDAMHEQMDQMMGSGVDGMMGGDSGHGMMGGSTAGD